MPSRREHEGRLHDLLIRMHPPRFRRRYGASTRQLYREWVAAAANPAIRRQRVRQGYAEALTTLVAAWWETVSKPTLRSARRSAEFVRLAGRSGRLALHRRPLQSVVIIGTLAIAIGANASLFAIARVLMVRDLPFRDADRVVAVAKGTVTAIGVNGFALHEEFVTVPGLESAAVYLADGSANLAGAEGAEQVRLAQVSNTFFDVLGVDLALGAGFTGVAEGEVVAVISYSLWRRAFAADPDVIGRDLRLNGLAYPVVGVAPPEVAFPGDAEAWLSFPLQYEFFGNAFGGDAIARLRSGGDLAAVQAMIDDRYRPKQLEAEAEGYSRPLPQLVPIRDHLLRDVSQPLWLLIAAALLVFLLGSLNLTSVWINETVERADEISIRRALGASRTNIFAQIAAETFSLALLGGVGALLLAQAVTAALATRLPADLPGIETAGIDFSTGLFVFALAVVAGLGFGGLAALRGARAGEASARRVGVTASTRRLQFGLAIAQGALALVLVVGAGLMVRSFQNLAATPLGFEPDGTLSFQVRVPEAAASTREARRSYVTALQRRLEELPGVEAVGINSMPLLSMEMGYIQRVALPGQSEEGDLPGGLVVHASPDYFRAAGIPVLSGRPFDAEWESRTDVIVDAGLARELFGEEPAVGREIDVMEYTSDGVKPRRVQVRGVVGSVHARGARSSAYPAMYYNLWASPGSKLGAVLRVRGNPADLIEAVRDAALDVNPAVAAYRIRTLRSAASELVAADRTLALTSSGFSLAALLLAALGVYGLVAQQVTRREREFGVRLALGALPTALVRRVVVRGAGLGAVALLVGLPAALFAARLVQSRLFQLAPFDPLTLVVGSGFLLVMTALASWIPARRIAGVDPRTALSAD